MADGLLNLIAQPQIADIAGGQRQFDQDQQRNLLFAQQQQELQRQQGVRGLVGAALGEQLGGAAGEIARQGEPDAALQVHNALGVVGAERQKQFAEDVRVADSLMGQDPAQARAFIEQSILRNESRGIPSPQMREFLAEFDQDPQQAASNLKQINQALNVGTPQERELRVKERGVELREQEIEQRSLDREAQNQARQEGLTLRREESELRKLQLEGTRETNSIKREQLQTQIAEKQRGLQFEASNAVDTVQNSIDTSDRLLEGEGLESAAGVSSALIFPTLPGTAAANFEAELEALKSQAFLTQVEKMKGLGALSENEGKKLAGAVGALDLSQSDKALRASIGRIRATLGKAKLKLQRKFRVEPGQNQQPEQQPQAVQVGRFTVEVVP